MTEEQFTVRIDQLIKNMTPALKDKCLQLFKSGAEDVDDYPDTFELPKMIFISALKYASQQYTSGNSEQAKIIRKLDRF